MRRDPSGYEKALEALAELRSEYRPVLDDDAMFGIGIKQSGGRFTSDLSLIVYVPEKRPLPDLTSRETIPKSFRGFPTDVVEHRGMRLQADISRYDPLVGGIEISREGDGTLRPAGGTLGGLVRDRMNGSRLLLTCGHVVRDPSEDCSRTVGRAVFQPTRGNPGSAVIGTVAACMDQGHPLMDWATVMPDGSRSIGAASIAEIGPVRGVGKADIGDAVKKRGRTTRLTSGFVFAVIPEEPGVKTPQIECATFPFDQIFALPGDSGSLVVNEHDEAVGLLYSLGREVKVNGQYVATSGMAFDINFVARHLQVDVAVSPGIASVTPNAIGGVVLTLGKVTISGWGFDQQSQVSFGGVPAPWWTFVSPTQMETTPPLGLIGAVDIQVSNRWEEVSRPSDASKFFY